MSDVFLISDTAMIITHRAGHSCSVQDELQTARRVQ